MTKSLKARCIRRWKVRFKDMCDSKTSPVWRKHHLGGLIRSSALITADCMVDRLAEANAKVDFGISGWSPEFSDWYALRRNEYQKEALNCLNEDASNEEIDDEIDAELECWND